MVTVSYHSINKQVRSAGSSSAGNIHMLRDGLGSTIQTFNFLNSIALSQRFAPYGTPVTQSNGQPQFSTDMRMGWVGSPGYRRTSMENAERYIQARHFSFISARWNSRDLLWPIFKPFSYAYNNPIAAIERTGLGPVSPGGLNPYGQCIHDAMIHMLTEKEACIACQQTVNHKKPDQAGIICAHFTNRRLGPQPPRIVLKPGGGHYESPPDAVNWLLDTCQSFLPTGADVLANVPGSMKDILCLKALKNMNDDSDNYCSTDDSSPVCGKYPNTPPEYWSNYCSYLQYAIDEWKTFCGNS